MTKIKLTLITAFIAAALGATTLATANPLVPMTDADAAMAIKRANISLQEAISYAERSVSGKAIAARFADNADRLAYIVDVVGADGTVQLVRVTADSGRVTGNWPKAEFQGDSASYPQPQ